MSTKQGIDIQAKINVLCLHGYTQNNTLFSKTINVLFKKNESSHLRFLVPNGNYIVSDGNYIVSEEETREVGGSWKTESFTKLYTYENIQESIDYIKDFIKEERIDCVLGFSQGAVFSSILLSQNILLDCKMAVIIAGSGIQDPSLSSIPQIDVEAILYSGEADTLCPPDGSRF